MSEANRPKENQLSSHALQPDEKDTLCLTAHTPFSYTPPYPWYINLTMVRMGSDVVLTVRAPTVLPPNSTMEDRQPGETSCVRFTREMWREFVKEVEKANKIWEATDYLDSLI